MSATPPSPGAVTIPEPAGVLAEPWSIGRIARLAALFGPAAIVASVSIGAGETIVVVQAGSWAGYDLLWLVLASVVVKGLFVTYLLGRYTAISGESIGARLVRIPGPRGWLLVAIILMELTAAGPLWAAIARPSADLLFYLLQPALPVAQAQGDAAIVNSAAAAAWGLSPAAWKSLFATTFIGVALFLGAGISFKTLERQQVIICCILVTGTIVGTIIVQPDYWAALVGSLRVGYVPPIPPWAPEAIREQSLRLNLATIFGYVGGSVMCYIAYANFVGIHRWGLCGHPEIETIRRRAAAGKPGDYLPNDGAAAGRLLRLASPLRWDVGLGALVLFIVTAAFMVAGAAALYPRLARGEIDSVFQGWSLLTDQAFVWKAIHPVLVWVYYICILAALWGTLQSYSGIYIRVTHEFLSAIWPEHTVSYRRLRIGICLYVFLAAAGLSWISVNFTTLINFVGFLSNNAGVAVAALAALWLNFQLPPLYRTRPWMLSACVASALVLVVVSSISGWELYRSMIGASSP